jgi:hypothetical protein
MIVDEYLYFGHMLNIEGCDKKTTTKNISLTANLY